MRIPILLLLFTASVVHAQDKLLPEDWDYARTMQPVARVFKGRPGVVLHVGDSITYSNPYSQWARAGAGKTDADKAILKWMNAGKDDDSDGWHLARFDHPAGGRSHTACSGLRLDECLAGGKKQMPSLEKMLDAYKPQVVVFMLGTNDASAGRKVTDFEADYRKAIDTIIGKAAVPIVSTIPPHHKQLELARKYNDVIRKIAKEHGLPLIDYEAEILARRPDTWNGTLMNKDDVHPSAAFDGTAASAAPTAENLKKCGYLLRGWLSVQKVAEVKTRVLDSAPKPVDLLPPVGQSQIMKGKAIVLPVTRDLWISEVGKEVDGNNGGSPRLKMKSYQEMTLVDFDPSSLKGKTVLGATLHVKLAGKERLHRVTVGTIGTEWVEGTATGYTPQKGSSCFRTRQHPDVPWTTPGSDFCSVILGQGGTIWRMADATVPDANGWQSIPVDPLVIGARVAGVSHGFLVFDDQGTEWTRNGNTVTINHFPNRYLHSRESGKGNAPYFTIIVGDADTTAPSGVEKLKYETANLPAGEALITWLTPADAVGFLINIDGKPVPRYLIPAAGRPGERVTMHLRDLGLKPGQNINFRISAVDTAGNVGEPTQLEVHVSEPVPFSLKAAALKPFTEAAALPKLGNVEVAIIDELDKVNPMTGAMIPAQRDGYLAANHLFSAKENRIRLHAARNEFVAFQILLRGPAKNVTASLKFADGPVTAFAHYQNVAGKAGPLPDPLVPIKEGVTTPDGQQSASLHAELFVPHDTAPGKHAGKLTLTMGKDTLDIAVDLDVWNFTLPDHLSFLCEMNGYSVPTSESGYYRQGHRHRTSVNIVPYSQSGRVDEGWGPRWDGKQLDWKAWDARFGKYFDGSAFSDLPRKNVPLNIFYLPLHENWPTPVEGNYLGGYWADRAFKPAYRQAFVEASKQFAEHCNAKGWNETMFHGFLNNKFDFKRNGWTRTSALWVLDEPASYQDFWALRWFASAFHEGVRQAPGSAKLLFRADISRPQWQRDTFDGLLDYNVVGGEVRNYSRAVLDRKRANGEIVIEYGGSNAVDDSNLQPLGWCLDSWSLGTDGVLPWLTIGKKDAWETGEATCLFYPLRQGDDEPVPSVRLKSYRRGQQDVEYLTLLGQTLKQPRIAIGNIVRNDLKLAPLRQGTGFTGGEDAGIITYKQLLPQDAWAMRLRVGQALDQAKPPAQKRLVEWKTPPRDERTVPPKYVANPS